MKFRHGKIHYEEAIKAIGLRRKEELAPIIGTTRSWITSNFTSVRPYLSKCQTKCVMYYLEIEEMKKCLSQK